MSAHNFRPGDRVGFRASACGPLDPCAHWRGTIVAEGLTQDAWVPVQWDVTYGRPIAGPPTFVDSTLLARIGTAAFTDRHTGEHE